MSAYTTQAQISGYMSNQQLIDTTDDTASGNVDQTILAQVISSVSNTVDAMLCSTYQVPFGSPAPTIVTEAATMFACEALMRRRLVPNEANPYEREAAAWRKTLAKIAQTRAGLDANTLAAVPPVLVEATCSKINWSTA